MGKQRRQSNRGKPNRGGGSGGRGAVLRGTQPNRGGGAGAGGREGRGISIHDSQAADDVIAERASREAPFGSTLSPQSSQAADDVAQGIASGEISARDISNMSDEARMSIPANMLPDAPAGMTWAEDRTLVENDFYR